MRWLPVLHTEIEKMIAINIIRYVFVLARIVREEKKNLLT